MKLRLAAVGTSILLTSVGACGADLPEIDTSDIDTSALDLRDHSLTDALPDAQDLADAVGEVSEREYSRGEPFTETDLLGDDEPWGCAGVVNRNPGVPSDDFERTEFTGDEILLQFEVRVYAEGDGAAAMNGARDVVQECPELEMSIAENRIVGGVSVQNLDEIGGSSLGDEALIVDAHLDVVSGSQEGMKMDYRYVEVRIGDVIALALAFAPDRIDDEVMVEIAHATTAHMADFLRDATT